MAERGRQLVAMVLAGALVATGLTLSVGARAAEAAGPPPVVSQDLSFTASDGVVLHASIGGYGNLANRPLIVEDSPYAPPVTSLDWVGTNYNFIELQWRGTGESGGSLDTTGTRDQEDLAQFLGWACQQPWSNGNIGLYGFSASAIVVYNAMHLPLPCVRTASLMAGTVDLYRDLFYIGGIPNLAAGAFVEGAIGAQWLADLPARLQQDPASALTGGPSYLSSAADVLGNPLEDAYWNERTFTGDANRMPILADTSFYDVEERGPFMAYNATKQFGSHLLVMGAHDGFPAGTPGPFPQYVAWFDHYVRGVANGVDGQPPVDLYLSNGSREQFLAGNVTHLTGSSWPLPATQWTKLYLSSAPSGSAHSLNDGSLSLDPQTSPARQSYPFLPSEPTETDPHTAAVLGPDGLDQAATLLPGLTDMALSEPTSLTYTSAPLATAVSATGPASLDISLASTSPYTDIVAILADVQPNGTAYPVETGQLRTTFPSVDAAKSLVDPGGDVMDPYNVYSTPDPSLPGVTRDYQVEMLPIGNRFAAGDRIRLYLVGTGIDHLPALPGVNTVSLGGAASLLTLPTVGAPGLPAALGA